MDLLVKVVLFVGFLTIVGFDYSFGITCYCDECDNNECNTTAGGLCFASIMKKSDGSEKRSYRCIEKYQFLFPENPRVCWNPTVLLPTYVNLCCNSSDFCNKNLHPELQSVSKNTTSLANIAPASGKTSKSHRRRVS